MPRRLTVLYDGQCRLCRRARAWLERQHQLVPLEFVAAGSQAARRRYPDLGAPETLDQLHVVDEAGGVYRGEKAWLLCLWALERYRGWSVRFARPEHIGRARRFIRWMSANRR